MRDFTIIPHYGIMSRETVALLIVALILVILWKSLVAATAGSDGHERAERREKEWYENRKRLT